MFETYLNIEIILSYSTNLSVFSSGTRQLYTFSISFSALTISMITSLFCSLGIILSIIKLTSLTTLSEIAFAFGNVIHTAVAQQAHDRIANITKTLIYQLKEKAEEHIVYTPLQI